MKKIIILLLIFTLTSCNMLSFLSATKAIITTDLDRRAIGAIADDELTDFSLETWAFNDSKLKSSHLNFNLYNKDILITGEVPNKEIKNYILTQVRIKESSIRIIINEMKIAKISSILSRANDSFINGKIKIALSNQEVFNPIHINFHTENTIVYLTGKVTYREAKKAGVIVANVNGVTKVIKYFNYIASIPQREIDRAVTKEVESTQLTAEIKDFDF